MHKWRETDNLVATVICSRQWISLAWQHTWHMWWPGDQGASDQEVSHTGYWTVDTLISDHVTCDNVVTDSRISMSRCGGGLLTRCDDAWPGCDMWQSSSWQAPGLHAPCAGCLHATVSSGHISHTTPDILIPGSRIRWMAAAQWLWWIFCGSEIPISHPT